MSKNSEWKTAFFPNTSNVMAMSVWIGEDGSINSCWQNIVGWKVDYHKEMLYPSWSARPVFTEDAECLGTDWFLIDTEHHRYYDPGNSEWASLEQAIAEIGKRLKEPVK